MPVTMSRAQRDAIYELVITRLTAIGDVWLSIKRRESPDAKRMGREFAEDLRLLENLGWAETIDRETVSLTQPPEELTRALARAAQSSLDVGGSLRVAREGRGGAKALTSGSELTSAEIAAATGLGRSTPGKALATLERRGMVRHPGERDARRLPDRWSASSTSATPRLRPGQFDGLVLDCTPPRRRRPQPMTPVPG
jgi:hypothetical protein